MDKIVKKAQTSSFWLWLLNVGLHSKIPFNKPHGLKIIKISDTAVTVKIPYSKKNLNHIKGLHACGLATLGEYASGLVLLNSIGIKNYRIIMESIEVKYYYQGKSDATAQYSIEKVEVEKMILKPLEKDGVVYYRCEIPIYDSKKNHLCTVFTNWQIKSWSKVKMKVE